ncbi:FAD-dependent monooxygenase [Streptacidiphilus sp. PB12-B1b]|uniref:FAD-dependent monooxygenase n=1 Tax=Streptacidiphilus sp. PB12-B1b TaxID=2705012 RepID=UPI0015F873BA|nr:FAD-dependent monooxygenase [Streptacidiphilus sp. PB12-B1b]
MRIVCVGGGPAGLYFSIVMKQRHPDCDITVLEREAHGSTYGWGVTYWGTLLARLRQNDPPSAEAIRGASVRWDEGVAHIRGGTTTHRSDEAFGIGRHRLLEILSARAAELGVRVEFQRGVDSLDQLPEADLVVAGDGVNSRIRQLYAEHFGTAVTEGRNRYVWLGTSKVFDSFTFSFVETPHGWIWFYGYAFSGETSTCIVECSPETWSGLGLDRLGDEEGTALLERLFAAQLDGHPLLRQATGTGAQWLSFRTLTNRSWHHGNVVLLGDAAHTTHYSIGAGTVLALEDAIGLAEALCEQTELSAALAAYERGRRYAILSTQSAARYSARWYENIHRYARLTPDQLFALLGQRHSPLLPYLPPRLYYRLNRAAESATVLRRLRARLGHRLARSLHARQQPTDAVSGTPAVAADSLTPN